MAKILKFQNNAATVDAKDFLQDGEDKLDFHQAGQDIVVLTELSTSDVGKLRPDRDWSNQELADLYRVKRLLDAAGVHCEIDRGLTDEGDPWFVFCAGDGEVFIHLCRIGGLFLLDSPNLRRPLQGVDFNGLIADFTNNSLPKSGAVAEEGERRVVRLERNGKVFLHPSALLTALIWTLFLAAEELVALAPKASTQDGAFDAETLFGDFEVAADGSLVLSEDVLIDHLAGSDIDEPLIADDQNERHDAASEEGDLFLRELNSQQGLTFGSNSIALGLSSLAIAFGFLSEVVLMDERNAILDAIRALSDMPQDSSDDVGHELALTSTQSPVTALLQDVRDFIDSATGVKTAKAAQDAEGETDPTTLTAGVEDALSPHDISTKTVQTVSLDVAAFEPQSELEDGAAFSTDMAPPADPKTEETADSSAVMEPAATTAIPVSLASLVESWSLSLREFNMGSISIQASFDLSSSEIDLSLREDTSDVGADLNLTTIFEAELEIPDQVQSFDATASAILDLFIARAGETEIIAYGNEILLIDTNALPTLGQNTYLMRWELDSGEIVSMVGLTDDFTDIGMMMM